MLRTSSRIRGRGRRYPAPPASRQRRPGRIDDLGADGDCDSHAASWSSSPGSRTTSVLTCGPNCTPISQREGQDRQHRQHRRAQREALRQPGALEQRGDRMDGDRAEHRSEGEDQQVGGEPERDRDRADHDQDDDSPDEARIVGIGRQAAHSRTAQMRRKRSVRNAISASTRAGRRLPAA